MHVASVMFWALRFFVGLVGMVAKFLEWRVGLVVLLSLAVDFMTYLWMALPLFTLRYELLVLLAVGAGAGTIIGLGRCKLSWWLPAIIGAAVVLLLRASAYLVGLGNHTLEPADVVPTLGVSAMTVADGERLCCCRYCCADRSASNERLKPVLAEGRLDGAIPGALIGALIGVSMGQTDRHLFTNEPARP